MSRSRCRSASSPRPQRLAPLAAGPLDLRAMGGLVADILAFLGLEGQSVELAVVDDAAMADIAGRSMGVATPTNVLAFPATEQAEATEALGEVVLNLDALRREALLYGQDAQEHLVRLLSHALLHLAGHDHGPVMESLTEAAVSAVKLRD